MKVFIYGEFGPMAIENSVTTHLKNSLGSEKVYLIKRISLPAKFQLVERVYRKITPQYSREIQKHNEDIIEQVASNLAPNSALIVFKGMEIYPETLKTIKMLGVKLFCFNPDHPFVYSGSGSGSKFMTESLTLYDIYFTYHHQAKTQLAGMSIKSYLIPFGYESMAIQQSFVKPEDELQRGCFIGNPNPERVEFFKKIRGKLPVDLFGSGWKKYFRSSENLRIHGPIHDKTHWQIMSRYRFQFNLMARHNPNAHNMRTFSAPASGAIVLAPRNRDHEFYFTDRKELYLFDNIQHSVELGQILLDLAFEQALEIRKAARARCIESGYSYSDRAKEMLLIITQEVGVD